MELNKKHIIVISDFEIIDGTSAGASRIVNYVKSLSLNNVSTYIYNYKDGLNEFKNNQFFYIKAKPKLKFAHYSILQLCFLFKILISIKNSKHDFVFFHYPGQPLINIISFYLIKYIFKYRIFLEINEKRDAVFLNLSLNKTSKITRIKENILIKINLILNNKFEKLIPKYDGLIVISSNLEKFYKLINNKTLRIPVLIDYKMAKLNTKKISYNLNEVFSIGFSGSISFKKEGFDIFYKALKIVKDKGFHFQLNLYGNFSLNDKDLLLNKIPHNLGISENIFFHGNLNREDLFDKLFLNHLLVVPRPSNTQTEFGLSTKMAEYSLIAKPILITDVSDVSLFFKDSYNAFIVKPGDEVAMADKIIYIINNYNLIVNDVVYNCSKTAQEKFDFNNYSESLLEFIFS